MSRNKDRLEYLRGELRAERISWEELHELQSLAKHISPGDVELLEAAGVPEFQECQRCESKLDEGGLCTDETCPFSETDQDDERGWAGHPERDKTQE
jgi:hypothetical protein